MGVEISRDPVEVLIVTRGGSALQGQLPALVESLGLRWRFCQTVYEAAAEVIECDRNVGLVIAGVLAELGREKYRFFALAAARRDVRCCILAGSSTDAEGLAAVVRWGATISASVTELAKEIRRGTEELQRRVRANQLRYRENPEGEMNVLSEAELEALLGEHRDEKSEYSIVR